MKRVPQVEVSTLSRLDREALLDLWQQFHDRKPPLNASRQFLRYCLAYRIQEIEHGGLGPSVRRELRQIAIGDTVAATDRRSRTPIRPGTRLLRTWQGRTYEVSVAEDGFVLDGERYRSLSAVARAITGTRWNGWTFFGIKQPANGA